MKKIDKIRIKEKHMFISQAVLLAVLAISWFFESYFAEILFMDYGAEDLIANARSILLQSIMTWERYIDSAMRYVVNFLPVFAVFPALPFLQERKSYFVCGENRYKHYRKDLIKSMLYYSVKGGAAIAVTFTAFFLIGDFFMYPSISNIGGFASVFPDQFYVNHPCLFFLFMTWTDYFLFGFAYGWMACGFALVFDKEIYVLMITLLIYLGESYMGYILDFLPFKISESVCAFNTLYTTGEIFVPILTLFGFDMILMMAGLKRRRKLIDG